jgi:hypothetical protein
MAAKLADMEPKQDRTATAGTGFVINIHNSGGQTVSVSTTPLPKPVDVIDVEPTNE